MMKQIISKTGVVLVMVFLTGCLQSNTIIRVKPDGSGTIEDTFLLKKELVLMMKATREAMSEKMERMEKGQTQQKPKKEQTAKLSDIFPEADLRKKAGNMGEGVTYVSRKKITTDKSEGYKAIYAFKDINKLKLNQNPSQNVPSNPGVKAKAKKQKEDLTFQFTKGSPSTLIIKGLVDKPFAKTGSSAKDSKKTKTNEQPSKAELAKMEMMLRDMKFGIAIEVQGSIVQTNATYRKKNRVTLVEMDFNKLLEKPKEFKKFAQASPKTIEEVKKLMKDLPDIQIELKREIWIKFK